jgi:hypothetical protein
MHKGWKARKALMPDAVSMLDAGNWILVSGSYEALIG